MASVRSRIAGVPWPDLAIAVVLAAAAVVSSIADPRAAHPITEIVAALVALSIALRTIAPLAMTVIISAGVVLLAFLPDPSTPLWAFATYLVVAYSIGAHLVGTRRILALVLLLVAGYVIQSRDPSSTPIEILLTPLILTAAPALAGWLLARSRSPARRLRELTIQLEASQAQVAELSAEAERARIARDLHDLLGHALSSIAVQAGAAGQLLGPDAAAAVPVERIRLAAHDGLNEVRALLAAQAVPPAPGPDRILALIRADGARLAVTGNIRPLPMAADDAAYRIVQEALTNARRHAPGAPVRVQLGYAPDALDIRVMNGGPVPSPGRDGRGLRGMRERAAACGGTVEAGPADDGWVVHAVLAAPPANGVRS